MENAEAKTSPLSFGKKISEHWIILLAAVIFDIFALIPLISVIFNLCFAGILYLYFASRGDSNFLKTGLLIGGASAIDLILSFLPVNVGAALYKILSKK